MTENNSFAEAIAQMALASNGCEYCNADMKVEIREGVVLCNVIHDDDCPFYLSLPEGDDK